MAELKEKVASLNKLIESGDTLHAMEIFYSDEVEMQENEDIPRQGKNICLETERKNLEKVTSVESHLLNQAIDEKNGVVFSEWKILVTYKDNSKLSLTEVSVQHWNAGKVLKEKFYYKTFQRID